MLDFFRSTVGKKYVMGITGLIWAGFVLGHMAGNMLIFVSKDAYNAYGHALTSGNLIYLIEAVLVGALLAHVACAISLTIGNRRAKPKGYAVVGKGEKATSVASRTMAAQGSLILAFVILHLVTFKFGTYYETTVNGVVMRDLARLFVEVFQNPIYVGWYVVCLILLGFHLSHGVKSIFQSFGILNRANEDKVKKLGLAYGAIVALGFLSQPIYAFLLN